MTRDEVQAVLQCMQGREWLMASLMYGAGLRVRECVSLRMKDVDFGFRQIVVRNGKGGKDRVTSLAETLVEPLKRQLADAHRAWNCDRADSYGECSMPPALARKYAGAAGERAWQYVFPASKRSRDPFSGRWKRHHIDESVIQRALKQAVRKTGLTKPASCHTLRHCFVTHLLAAGHDIRTIQELLGHKDLSTTMIYTHVLGKGGQGMLTPLDMLVDSCSTNTPRKGSMLPGYS